MLISRLSFAGWHSEVCLPMMVKVIGMNFYIGLINIVSGQYTLDALY